MTKIAGFAILALFGCFWIGEAAEIMVVFPIPSHSHFILGLTLAKGLAEKGHQVTFVNPFPEKVDFKNIKSLSTESLIPVVEEHRKMLFELEKEGAMAHVMKTVNLTRVQSELTMTSPGVQDLLKSKKRFDAVIVEHMMNDALAGLAYAFGAHLILMLPITTTPLSNYIFANPAPSSYVPNFGATFSKNMTFFQRLVNLFMNIATSIFNGYIVLPQQRAVFEKHISKDVTLDAVLSNATLMLSNSHISVMDAKPHVPNIVEIGGFHVKRPQPLPQDLQKFLDGATEGAVLFSMGSNLKGKDLKPEVLAAILQSFGKIKQKVLWKFEADIENLPANVKILKWIPQNDVLAHPNIRAFISHGGLLSTIETVYHGVPIIGIPVFGDQKTNIASAVRYGYALTVPLEELNEEKLTAALQEMLNNPKYQQNIQQRSKAMRDRPMQPLDTAIYWIEYVIRHQGAPLLRNGGMNLTWYQRHMLDIAIFLTLVTIVLFVIFYLIIKWILGLCLSSRRSKETTSKRKKD